jgi:hypothetical protein
MFSKYASLVLALLTERGSFDTTPETLVNHALEVLSGLVQADQIATQGEVEDTTTVRSAFESTVKDVIGHTIEALNRTRVLKAVSQQADLTQQFSDNLWLEADLIAADLELILDRCDPEELTGWLESRW